MNGGLLVIGLGVWVLCQVFGGDALRRLGIITDSDSAPPAAATPAPAGGSGGQRPAARR